MAKESALCQLMKVRMNGIMNGITNSDGEYQAIIRKSDVYSDKVERMGLPEEARLLRLQGNSTSSFPVISLFLPSL